jgi:hypothetical protein
MSKSPSRRFPVTITQLPVTRGQVCHGTIVYRPGDLSEVLTEALPPGPSKARPHSSVAGRGDPHYHRDAVADVADRDDLAAERGRTGALSTSIAFWHAQLGRNHGFSLRHYAL